MTALKDTAFAEAPPVGLAIAICGQRYDLLSIEPYVRRNGEASHLGVWEAKCAMCGKPFVTKAPVLSMPGSRRCEEHRQPGVAVSNRVSGQRQFAQRYGRVEK